MNEFMFRSACLAVDEAQGRTADQVKQTAKLDSNRPQSLLALVCTKILPKRKRFGQGDSGLVASKQAQPMPTAAVLFAGCLEPRYQRAMQPGQRVQGKNAHEPCRKRPRKWTIGWQALPWPSGGSHKDWIDGCPTTQPTSATAFPELPTCDDGTTLFSHVVVLPARTQELDRATA